VAVIITDARIWFAQFDLSGTSNQVDLSVEADEQDSTNFDSNGWRARKAGPKDATHAVSGFMDPATSDVALRDALGHSRIVTVAAAKAAGSTAWLGRRMGVSLTPSAQVGSLSMLTGSLRNSTPEGVVRGIVAADRANRGTTGNGSVFEQGAVSATQKAWATLHIFSVAGGSPTLDVTVASDDSSGFASPTTRLTFDQATGVGSQIKSVAGAITDDHWRVSWTLGGSDPVFGFAVAFGIA